MDISVVIPVYNMEKYLAECLESVINQTVSFADIIVIDDGSTDASLAICHDYVEKNKNIAVYHQENRKQGAARNHGLKYVKSEYVLFLDADDMLRQDTVEKLTEILMNKSLDVMYFDADIINEAEGYKADYNYNREQMVSSEIQSGMEYFEKYYPEGYIVQPGMAVYRMEMLRKYRICFPEECFYEDNVFALKCMLEAAQVSYFSERLYIRRYRAGSVMTGEMTCKKYQDMRKVFFLCWDYMVNKADYFGEKKYLYFANTFMELKWALEKCDLSGICPTEEKYFSHILILFTCHFPRHDRFGKKLY